MASSWNLLKYQYNYVPSIICLLILLKYLNSQVEVALSTNMNIEISYISTKIKCTLTDLDSRCPGSLLKATPPPPGYPWVSGVRYVTPEPRFSGLVLDHQGLEELELKNHPKTAVFDQIWLFLSGFLALVLLKVDGRAPNPYFWVLGSHTEHQIPMGTLGAVE